MSNDDRMDGGKLYVMPKVSVVLQQGDYAPMRAYNYSYANQTPQRRSVLGFVASLFTTVVGFFFVVALFAIPVSVTSVLLISAVNSETVSLVRTQEVPSDGVRKEYIVEKYVPPVVPADR